VKQGYQENIITDTKRTPRVHIKIERELARVLLCCCNNPGVERVTEPRETDRIDTCQTVNKGIELTSGVMVVCWRGPLFVLLQGKIFKKKSRREEY
jgi:hypothetical protein